MAKPRSQAALPSTEDEPVESSSWSQGAVSGRLLLVCVGVALCGLGVLPAVSSEQPALCEVPSLRLWSAGPWRTLRPGYTPEKELRDVARAVVASNVRGWLEEARARAAIDHGGPLQFSVYVPSTQMLWTVTLPSCEKGRLEYVSFSPCGVIQRDFEREGLEWQSVPGEGGSVGGWWKSKGVEYQLSTGGQFDAPKGALDEVRYVRR